MRPALWPEIRALLLAAMLFFVYTIGIGILNGTDLVDFEYQRILGHVHGGTLGWLTLAVFAAALWLFGGEEVSGSERSRLRLMVGYSIVVFALYVVAFSTTYGSFRPAMGVLSTLAILAFLVWIAIRARQITLTVPHLGFLVAVATSIGGGVFGVLWALQIATGDQWLPSGGEDAHPAMMVIGFLLPVALGMSEWAFAFPNPEPATRLGVIQMICPFLGGLVLMLALLLDIVPLAPIAVLLEVTGIVIFIVRMWPHLRRVRIGDGSPGRWAAVAALSSVFVIGLTQSFVIEYEGDFDLIPPNEFLALSHAEFIGAMTSAVFAMLVAATAHRLDKRMQDLTFGMVVGGIVVFVIGLLADATAIKRIGAPVMGVGLLVGLAMFGRALWAERPEMAPS